MSEPMLQLDGLVRHFDGVRAVDDVSFSVERGQVLGFIGPNGAGKTTTMRILATLDMPQQRRRAHRRLLGGRRPEQGPADHGLHAGLRRRLREHDRDRVPRLLRARVRPARGRARHGRGQHHRVHGLGDLRDRHVESLSKGLKQRVALGRAIIHDPQLLILDEPAANLDPRARIEFRTLIRELAADGKTILLSSHILTELAEMCDTVAVIEKGRILATGTVQEILEGVAAAADAVACGSPGPTTGSSAFCSSSRAWSNVHEARRPSAVRVRRRRRGAGGADRPAHRRRIPGARVHRPQRRPRGRVHRNHGGPRAVSASPALLRWLDDTSDRLSPIVVKEVRQIVRGREFNYSFGVSLVSALSSRSSAPPTRWTADGTRAVDILALTVCLALLGLAVVPLGAFSALRNERLEQTLDLITLTALSPRRVVIGKLLAQAVKLTRCSRRWRRSSRRAFCSAASISSPSSSRWRSCSCGRCGLRGCLLAVLAAQVARHVERWSFGASAFVLLLVVPRRQPGAVRLHARRIGDDDRRPDAGRTLWWTLAIMTLGCAGRP